MAPFGITLTRSNVTHSGNCVWELQGWAAEAVGVHMHILINGAGAVCAGVLLSSICTAKCAASSKIGGIGVLLSSIWPAK